MDLRSCAASLWILAAILLVPLLAEREPGEVEGSPCPDHARLQVKDGGERGAAVVLACPGEEGGRALSTPRGAVGLLMGRPIDIDLADEEELRALPGIGPGLSKRILAEREANGTFGSVDALSRVPGLGEKRIDALRGLVTAGGP